MPKYWALGAVLAASFGCSSVSAQTIPDEYSKRIASHSEIGTLADDLAGDRIDLSRGSLEVVQTDVDLPGNSALPVRVIRRLEAGDTYAKGHFGYWNMDLPSVHGTFDDIVGSGWEVESQTGGYTENRCSSFGRPPSGFTRGQTSDAIWESDDYWHGTFFHLPETGDQELLNFWTESRSPLDGRDYYAVTKSRAVARCVALATTSDSSVHGEGFEVVTTDGVVYTLNQMAKRYRGALGKGRDSLPRADFFLFPTRVADRFGNSVTYTWSTTNPWQLQQIRANDGRQLDFTYESSTSARIVKIVDGGGREWHYAYPAVENGYDATTVTLPDGSKWTSRLGALASMQTIVGTTHCNGIDGVTQRTGYDSGPSGDNPHWGSITAPSGATVTFWMASILMGRSHVSFECITDVPDADPINDARPQDPYLFYSAAVVGKTITGPGLPANLHWSYAYGPTNNCWDGIDGVANQELYGIPCSASIEPWRYVKVTDPAMRVTRYKFGNQADVNEGMLYTTEYAWNGTTAQRTVSIEYGDPTALPYGAFVGWSPRGFGDPKLSSRNQPQRRVKTTQQGRDFIWEVADDCNGTYCFDSSARPTKIIRTSRPEATP